jgi:hypothetical protein
VSFRQAVPTYRSSGIQYLVCTREFNIAICVIYRP